MNYIFIIAALLHFIKYGVAGNPTHARIWLLLQVGAVCVLLRHFLAFAVIQLALFCLRNYLVVMAAALLALSKRVPHHVKWRYVLLLSAFFLLSVSVSPEMTTTPYSKIQAFVTRYERIARRINATYYDDMPQLFKTAVAEETMYQLHPLRAAMLLVLAYLAYRKVQRGAQGSLFDTLRPVRTATAVRAE